MKKLFIATVTGAIVMSTSMALAADPYVKVNVGYNMLEDSDVTLTRTWGYSETGTMKYEAGVFTSAAIGYDYGQFRLDGELAYSSNDVENTVNRGRSFDHSDYNLSQVCAMANVYRDIDTGSIVTPYVGGGIGFSTMIYEEGSDDWDDTVFAYQVTAGLMITINSTVDLDLAYRYFGTSEPTFQDQIGSTLELDYNSHILMGGIKLNL